MNYKIIATDLDGTLLQDVFSVSDENYKAIEKYTAMGGLVVPASGRCFYEMPQALRDCPDIRYYISSNGSVITDSVTGENDEVLISDEKFEELKRLLGEYETCLNIHYCGKSFMLAENDTEERASYYNLNRYYYQHFHENSEKLQGFEGAFSGGVEMVAVFFKYQRDLDECVERLNALGGVIATSSTDFNVEIIAKGASKGDGIRRLAKKLGVSTEQIIGVGDSPNDIALLGGAGLALAVENADEILKDKAEKIICHHTEHVIKYILENIIEA
jgi:Cof subfamily protein (haloacid dehalogenase superfamily)